MGGFYPIIGAIVTWVFIASFAWLLLYIGPWRFVGYLYGYVRICKAHDIKPKLLNAFKWAAKNWSDLNDEWYQDIGDEKVYLYGFRRVEKSDWIDV